MGIISQRMVLALGQVAPERQYIFHMGIFQLVQYSFDFPFIGSHTGEMGQGRHPAPFDFGHQGHTFANSRPAGSVGDTHVIHSLDGNGPDDFLGMFQFTALFGREQFAGYADLGTL